MVTRTYSTRRQGVNRYRPRFRRRSNLKKYINHTRTARAQQKQIRRVANIAMYNRRHIRMQQTYCDWTYFGQQDGGTPAQFIVPLMDPNSWSATMRQNLDVITQQRTYVQSMMFNYYLDTSALNNPCYTTMFLVTLRKNANAWDGSALTENVQWASQGNRNAVLLNPNWFSVKWTRFFVTSPLNQAPVNSGDEPIPYGQFNQTYRRGRVGLNPKYNIIAPAGGTWKTLQTTDMPPSKRLYLIVFFGSDSPLATRWTLEWGIKAVTRNAD